MNPRILGIATFRSLAMLFSLQGNAAASATLNFIADGIKSGNDVDAYMRDVADAQAAGIEPDWAALHDRINAEGERLQGKTSAAKSTASKSAKNGGPGPDPVAGFTGKSGRIEDQEDKEEVDPDETEEAMEADTGDDDEKEKENPFA